MDVADGKCHVAYLHHKFAVTLDAYDVALAAFEEAGGETYRGVPLGVILQRMAEDADAGGIVLRHSHERSHDGVRDDGGLPAGTVLCQMEFGKFLFKIGVDAPDTSLYEDQAADGGFADFAAVFLRMCVCVFCFVDKTPEVHVRGSDKKGNPRPVHE